MSNPPTPTIPLSCLHPLPRTALAPTAFTQHTSDAEWPWPGTLWPTLLLVPTQQRQHGHGRGSGDALHQLQLHRFWRHWPKQPLPPPPQPRLGLTLAPVGVDLPQWHNFRDCSSVGIAGTPMQLLEPFKTLWHPKPFLHCCSCGCITDSPQGHLMPFPPPQQRPWWTPLQGPPRHSCLP